MKLRKSKGRNGASATVVIVRYVLKGEKADRFLRYMEKEELATAAAAGRKLGMERLTQVENAGG